tara:strand:- start:870 stop:1427 length:558 start_codon:yes stop_codon:yes gene_type:complete
LSSKSNFSNTTSKSYASALYELSKESAELDKVEEGINSLSQLMKESLDFKNLILNPTVSKEDKKNIMLAIADKNNFSAILKKFLSFLSIKNRLFFLNKICDAFLNLISVNKNELRAKIVSPKKLSDEEKKIIEKELSEDFKSSLSINYEYNPDLIAGLTIQIGSTMVDTSIKSKLKKLEKSMREA